jgi:D-psicose/D-tagatose/L-ribulose 3-epimerase
MRFGYCGSMISPATDPIGIESIESAMEAGFDYVELSLSDCTALPEDRFAALVRRLDGSGIRCEACNNFFPRTVRLTGAEARLPVALDYAGLALDRAARLGARIVVFGSSGAKNVPVGFPQASAWSQLVDLLLHLGPVAGSRDITIAIEPLHRLESNIVNLAAEGLRLAREVNHPNIQLLIDYYHLSMEHEAWEIIAQAGEAIRHLHFAQVEGRRFPSEQNSADYTRFFETIRSTRYSGRCSIEAYTDDFPGDARRALGVLRRIAEIAECGCAGTQR